MTYPTRRARIEAEKAQLLAQRSHQSKRFSLGVAGLATAASATLFGMAPANAAIEDPPAAASSNTTQSAGTYTVQSGDTLSAIAHSQGVSLSALMSENNLSGSSIIYPGDTLQLPGSGTGSASATQASSSGSASSQGDRTSAQVTTYSTASVSANSAAASKALEIVNSGAIYKWGGNGPSAYDCSGFTTAVLAAAGKELPRNSAAQFSGAKSYVSLSNLQAGDLVFWSNNGSASGIYHVAVYIGDGKIAQARNPQSGISVNSLSEYSKYNPPMTTAARY
ncbi:C40 family peptidase [Enteractinococcus helveticum]|uniref:Uncharacterized protein n=1 Tax=Enteractinococcus helveticum TaxID=1837282 RepID=A0A1B7LYJ8_9MICC|nr:C40 family peptidase [Enteractinococcus helveticum]OAV60486.1 hypothetical protein A6F49_10980 [Enteractinococcus helveticum]